MPRKQLSASSNSLLGHTKSSVELLTEDREDAETVFAQYQAIWATPGPQPACSRAFSGAYTTDGSDSWQLQSQGSYLQPGRKVVRHTLNIASELSKTENRVEMKRVCSLPSPDDVMQNGMAIQ